MAIGTETYYCRGQHAWWPADLPRPLTPPTICPTCGRCPACGSEGHTIDIPWMPPGPWTPYPPYWYTHTSTDTKPDTVFDQGLTNDLTKETQCDSRQS
jgi:hypothetical protein